MKQTKLIYIILLLLTTGFYGQAQKEANNWFFGSFAGMTWNTTQSFEATGLFGTPDATLDNIPTALIITPATMSALEGCFSLSDSEGNLLFYSDGMTIWNRKHQKMENGTDLTGHPSSAQSGIILPYPERPTQYIAVTLGDVNTNNLSYSVIDMTRNGGDGAVISKNIPFSGHSGVTGESVCAIRHANKRDYWLVAPGKGTPSYLNTWLITSRGIQNTTPAAVIQLPVNVSDSNSSTGTNGYFKFSPNGKYFAWSTWCDKHLIYGEFDNSTDRFSNIKYIREETNAYGCYGVEFSLSGKYLYTTLKNISTNSMIQAYDFKALLKAENPATVTPKEHEVRVLGAMQLGPDGRIYVSPATSGMIVIDNPEEYNNLRIYELKNILSPRANANGLPTFAPSFFMLIDGEPEFCVNSDQSFSAVVLNGIDEKELSHTEWDFGDGKPESIVTDTDVDSGEQTHSYIYDKPGMYTITLKAFLKSNGSEATSLRKTFRVTVNPCMIPVNPNVHLFND